MPRSKLTAVAILVLTLGLGVSTAKAQRMHRADTEKIQRANLDSSHVEELVRTVLDSPEGIALDRVAVLLSSSATATTDLHVSVQSGGSDSITVSPGARVRYEVVGMLSGDANEGLALVGFNLVFDGGDLTHADIPTGEPTPGCDNPMINFTKPWGITNPAGYGGTVIDGDLIQVGGAQNTINNGQLPCLDDDDCPSGSTCDGGTCTPVADFPIGPVLTGVAQPGGCGPAVLVTGTLTAPDAEGAYTLAVTELFANVIKEGETGDPYWATEATGVGTITPLSITIAEPVIAALDIKPGSCPNPVNVRSRGVVPMAVVGSESVDVTEVDIDSLVLTRADGVGEAITPITKRLRAAITIEDVATPFDGEPCDCQELDADGIDDLVLRFSTAEIVGALELDSMAHGASVMLTVSGSLLNGTLFEASDCVAITGFRGRRVLSEPTTAPTQTGPRP